MVLQHGGPYHVLRLSAALMKKLVTLHTIILGYHPVVNSIQCSLSLEDIKLPLQIYPWKKF